MTGVQTCALPISETPAPLALVESRRLGFVLRSVLVTRSADDSLELPAAFTGNPERARGAGAELARWHARGIEAEGLGLRFSADARRLVATLPEKARLRALLSPADAERDLERIGARLGPTERRALVEGYRAAAAS